MTNKASQKNSVELKDIAVLLVGYNRPELLEKRILELTNPKPINLYISIDGGVESHTPEMEKVKELAKSVFSGQHFNLQHYKNNLGLVLHITGEISRILLKYEYIIVIEDDVKLSKTFLENMVQGLNIQKQLGLKGIVSGSSPLFNQIFNNKWRRTHNCYLLGWACSSSTWRGYAHDLSKIQIENMLSQSEIWQNLNDYQKSFWLSKFRKVQSNPLYSWDYQLLFHLFINNFINLTPIFSITGNEGFSDSRAIHTKGKKPRSINNLRINSKVILKISNYSILYNHFDHDGSAYRVRSKLTEIVFRKK